MLNCLTVRSAIDVPEIGSTIECEVFCNNHYLIGYQASKSVFCQYN